MPVISYGTTFQRAVGGASLSLAREADSDGGFGDYLVWTGTDNRINFLNRAPSVSPDIFAQGPIGTDNKSDYGPAWVMLPDHMTGYYLYVSKADGKLVLRKFTRKPSPGPGTISYEWNVGDAQAFPNALPGSAPSAHLSTQNGRLCLNVAWAAKGTGTICLGQVFLDLAGGAVTFSSVLTLEKRACADGPCLIRDGRRLMLAYFDKADNTLRLAHSGDHAFDFDPARDCAIDIKSFYAPSITRLNAGLVYVAYVAAETSRIAYAIAGSGADGKFKLAVRGAVSQDNDSSKTAPTAWSYREVRDGVTNDRLLITFVNAQTVICFARMSVESPVIPM